MTSSSRLGEQCPSEQHPQEATQRQPVLFSSGARWQEWGPDGPDAGLNLNLGKGVSYPTGTPGCSSQGPRLLLLLPLCSPPLGQQVRSRDVGQTD